MRRMKLIKPVFTTSRLMLRNQWRKLKLNKFYLPKVTFRGIKFTKFTVSTGFALTGFVAAGVAKTVMLDLMQRERANIELDSFEAYQEFLSNMNDVYNDQYGNYEHAEKGMLVFNHLLEAIQRDFPGKKNNNLREVYKKDLAMDLLKVKQLTYELIELNGGISEEMAQDLIILAANNGRIDIIEFFANEIFEEALVRRNKIASQLLDFPKDQKLRDKFNLAVQQIAVSPGEIRIDGMKMILEAVQQRILKERKAFIREKAKQDSMLVFTGDEVLDFAEFVRGEQQIQDKVRQDVALLKKQFSNTHVTAMIFDGSETNAISFAESDTARIMDKVSRRVSKTGEAEIVYIVKSGPHHTIDTVKVSRNEKGEIERYVLNLDSLGCEYDVESINLQYNITGYFVSDDLNRDYILGDVTVVVSEVLRQKGGAGCSVYDLDDYMKLINHGLIGGKAADYNILDEIDSYIVRSYQFGYGRHIAENGAITYDGFTQVAFAELPTLYLDMSQNLKRSNRSKDSVEVAIHDFKPVIIDGKKRYVSVVDEHIVVASPGLKPVMEIMDDPERAREFDQSANLQGTASVKEVIEQNTKEVGSKAISRRLSRVVRSFTFFTVAHYAKNPEALQKHNMYSDYDYNKFH